MELNEVKTYYNRELTQLHTHSFIADDGLVQEEFSIYEINYDNAYRDATSRRECLHIYDGDVILTFGDNEDELCAIEMRRSRQVINYDAISRTPVYTWSKPSYYWGC